MHAWVTVGDLKTPLSRIRGRDLDMLTDFFAECGLAIMIDGPTRKNSLLDFLISTDAALMSSPRVTANFGTSDHCDISIGIFGSSGPVVAFRRRDYSRCHWSQINDYLSRYD